jgi:hypothetical protein
MIDRIIKEIKSALNNEEFLAALALALTLPDTCGKAEFPTKGNRDRYIGWYDEYVGKYEKPPKAKSDNGLVNTLFDDMPYMNGEIIYSLRCCFLHQETPNIEKDRIRDPQCKVTRFTLIITGAINGGSSSVSSNPFIESEKRTLEINIVNLCCKLCLVAKSYYEDNKEKFDFFDYDLQDRRVGGTDIMWRLPIPD